MLRGLSPLCIYSPREANRRPPRSQAMMTLLPRSRDSSNRAVAEAAWGSGDAHVQSTATRQPRPQAIGARGASHLTLGFASKPSPSAPWAPGLLSAFWERGSPDLPVCGPWRGCAGRSVRPIIINKAFKTLARGQASRGEQCKTSSGAASPGRLTRGGEIKAWQTSRGPRDVSHDDRDQAGARRVLARAASSFPLWC